MKKEDEVRLANIRGQIIGAYATMPPRVTWEVARSDLLWMSDQIVQLQESIDELAKSDAEAIQRNNRIFARFARLTEQSVTELMKSHSEAMKGLNQRLDDFSDADG